MKISDVERIDFLDQAMIRFEASRAIGPDGSPICLFTVETLTRHGPAKYRGNSVRGAINWAIEAARGGCRDEG